MSDFTNLEMVQNFLRQAYEFMQANPDYSGYYQLVDRGYAYVVTWEPGFGKEPRTDAIQCSLDPDWALVTGVKIYNPFDTPDNWLSPYDEKTGEIIAETCSIEPDDVVTDFLSLAKYLISCYNDVIKEDDKLDKEGNCNVTAH